MTVSYKILTNFDLVYFRFDGLIRAGETTQAYGDLLAHPGYRPDLRQFADFSPVTALQFDMERARKIMDQSASELRRSAHPRAPVFLAPTRVGHSMALLVAKIWQEKTGLSPEIADSFSEALALLDLDFPDMDAFLREGSKPTTTGSAT